MKKWSDIKKELCAPEEAAEIEREAAEIGGFIKSRNDGITQQGDDGLGKSFIISSNI